VPLPSHTIHSMEPITFFTAVEKDLRRVARLDPDRDWEEFAGGAERVWILQTYLRLKAAGYPVQISSDIPADGIVILHRQSELEYFCQRFLRFPTTVTTNADTGIHRWADAEIVQDPTKESPGKAYYIPFWPQPGLIPRDRSRGSAIRKVGFKGSPGRLDPAFTSDDWRQFLRSRMIQWDYDVRIQEVYGELSNEVRWNDYSEVDLIIALDSFRYSSRVHKPPNKLVNAWLAGVPAILGPEPAFRTLRRGELDYLEVESYEEAKRAVDFLRANPERYQAMVKNGQERGAEFAVPRIVKRWGQVLFQEVPSVLDSWRSKLRRMVPLRLRRKIWNTFTPCGAARKAAEDYKRWRAAQPLPRIADVQPHAHIQTDESARCRARK